MAVTKIDDGVLIRTTASTSSLRGSVKPKSKPENFKAMRKNFEEYLSNMKNG